MGQKQVTLHITNNDIYTLIGALEITIEANENFEDQEYVDDVAPMYDMIEQLKRQLD